MTFNGDESELSIDVAYKQFRERLDGGGRALTMRCYEIIDPYTAQQIEVAAQRAEYGGDVFERWTEKARVNAGYGHFDLMRDPR